MVRETAWANVYDTADRGLGCDGGNERVEDELREDDDRVATESIRRRDRERHIQRDLHDDVDGEPDDPLGSLGPGFADGLAEPQLPSRSRDDAYRTVATRCHAFGCVPKEDRAVRRRLEPPDPHQRFTGAPLESTLTS